MLPLNPRGKNSTNSPIHPGTMDENKNFKVHTIKILVLYKRHRIFKEKKKKWSTMAGTFNTTPVTEIILKLLEIKSLRENLHETPFD